MMRRRTDQFLENEGVTAEQAVEECHSFAVGRLSGFQVLAFGSARSRSLRLPEAKRRQLQISVLRASPAQRVAVKKSMSQAAVCSGLDHTLRL